MSTPPVVAIVGAGVAGLACARTLHRHHVAVRLFDKGRFPGGRVATRETGVGDFDHGAQFLRLRGADFADAAGSLQAAGHLRPWDFHGAAPGAWVGAPRMRQLPLMWAEGLPLQCSVTVTRIQRRHDGWWLALRDATDLRSEAGPFDAVMLTLPVPQMLALLPESAPPPPEVRYDPCLTLMAVCRSGGPASVSSGDSDGPVAWMATEHDKPGRGGPPRITVQAGPQWSEAHFDVPVAEVQAQMVQALAARDWSVDPVSFHRWRYARVITAAGAPQWHPEQRLGYAGDGFAGPRVGAAWDSGVRLAQSFIERRHG